MNNAQMLIYKSSAGNIKIDDRLEEENIWLTQKLSCLRQAGRQVAGLFQTTVPNINMHLKSIYEERELEEKATIKDFLIIQKDIST